MTSILSDGGSGGTPGIASSPGALAKAVTQQDAAVTIAAAERIAAEQDPYLRRKQLWMFDLFDANRDGAVTPDDTMQFAYRLAQLTGYAEDSPRAQQLVATVNAIWHALVVKPAWVTDTSRVDAEQFVTVMANSVSETPDKTLQYIGVITSLGFAMADGDNNGLITLEDGIRLGTEVLGVEQRHIEHVWEVLDTDADGSLSYAEALMAVTDFIISADPRAMGNLALGTVV